VLFLASDSTGILRLDREAHRIEDELRASVHRDTFDFKTSWAVRADDLTREILYHAPRIVHFASHGEIDSLALASNACDEHHVTSESLVELFQKFRDQIRVVVINACKSKALARAISEYVDCAIGMDGLIDDSSAITFAYAFYRGIMAGQSVQGAFDLAKVELQLQNSGDANAPFLFCKSGIDPSNIVFTPISAA
jgi:hypothetical protein